MPKFYWQQKPISVHLFVVFGMPRVVQTFFHLWDNVLQIEKTWWHQLKIYHHQRVGLLLTERQFSFIFQQQTLTDSFGLSSCAGSWYLVSVVKLKDIMTYSSQSCLAVICLTAFLQSNVKFTCSFTAALTLRFSVDRCGERNFPAVQRPKLLSPCAKTES